MVIRESVLQDTVKEDSMLTRRNFLKTSVIAAGGYALAAEPVLAQAIQTDPAGLMVGDVTVKSGNDSIPAYQAYPSAPGQYPVIVVISEIWGLHEYIRDVARRFAKEGFYAIAPEMFHREGGVAHLPNVQEILKVVMAVPRKQILQDLSATAAYARGQAVARANRVGVTGFCWGGSTTMQYAAHDKDLGAAVAWYGPPGRAYQDEPQPVSSFDVAKDIRCPFLGLFGEEDKNPPPEDVRKFEAALKQHNQHVEMVIYPNAGHAFHADYRQSYRPDAAKDGWTRCVGWFKRYLST
jgi:carboxymethylenebutenolidase